MTGRVLVLGFSAFFILIFFHIILRRIFKIKKEICTLAALFLLVPFFDMAALWYLRVINFTEFLSTTALTSLLGLAYLQTYPALKNEIPTFRILFLIHRSEKIGLEETEILKQLNHQKELYFDKIEEMEHDGFVGREGDRLVLKKPGLWIAGIFIFYRRLLGLGLGKG